MPARPTTPVKLTAAYIVAGTAWILVTDDLLQWREHRPLQLLSWHTGKGLAFVAVTGLFLYRWAARFRAGAAAEAVALARAQARTEQSRRMYATLSAVNRRIIRPADAATLCQSICEALIDPGAFSFAWIGRVDDGGATVRVTARAGLATPAAFDLRDLPPGDPRVVLQQALRSPEPVACGPAAHDPCAALPAGRPAPRSCASVRLTPRANGRMLLTVGSDAPELFTPAVLAMLSEMAADLEYGLDVITDRETRAATEAALRASEQALAAEAARSHALLDISVDGIHILDSDGRLIDANDTFLRQRGYTREHLARLRITDWNAEADGDELRRRLAAIGPTPRFIETRHRRQDGSVFDVEIVTVALHLESRRVICASARDITDRRTMEQQLLRAQRLESIGLIASGIAHDLNNVLTPILLSTGLLEIRYGAPEDHALLDAIESAARRGSSIVQQILTFARGAEGQRVAIEPPILLKELSHLIRETFPRNIVHRLDIAPDARPISGDPTQLHQVFLNLAVNARDAMPQGGTLTFAVQNREVAANTVRAIPPVRPGGYVCITVSDTGTGMTPEVLDHLFEPFFTTKPRGRGTGLGLSTVHGLVRSHGGFVEVASELGHGSAFRVFLPAATGTGAAVGPARSATPRALGCGRHVLVVDDEPAILAVADSVLRRHGFVPVTASDGHEALAAFESLGGRVVLVIADVMMPKFDGVRLAAEIRQRHRTLPIIAMSGLIAPTPDDDNRRQLHQLGVTTILDKPYGERELLRAVENALEATA